MTVKRTRTSTETELAPPAAVAKSAMNQTVAAVQSQARTVNFGSSSSSAQESSGGVGNRSRLGGFLERCQYCKKRIPEGVEVFMYKDFSAFCSNGCRDIQISLDKLAKRLPTSSKDVKKIHLV